jgi:hypothetical protein
VAIDDLREKFFDELMDKLNRERVKRLKLSTPTNGRTIKLNGIVLCKISKNSPYKEKGLVIWKHLTQEALNLVGGMRAKGKKDWAAAPLTSENYSELMKLLMDVAIKSKSFKSTMRPKRTRKRGPKHQASMAGATTKTVTGIGNITYNIDELDKIDKTDPDIFSELSGTTHMPARIKIKAKKRKRR